ncbi:sulfurtransferase 18 [Arabidopsis thaliana]|uniref:Sulfurtransferase 18 n=1 Tax=Arabidopsis thaliana TaxID=3702 RepID=A8MS23_ARATH|nr:sulfurtransferase 18 [Arabidopsis thaliana]AED98168.1 sulfurtransferase 18 [Arabidopsis thaliana]|eukprot:NP_569030.2 sulfurtransferase 18 [Arabidopsis thaliana]
MSQSISSSTKAEEVVSVDVSQAKTLLQSGHQYLDVRTQDEFRRGHCEAAKIVNIPYMLNTPQGRVKNQEFLEQVSSLLNPADDILVGCQSGARSLKATTELVAAVRLQESEKRGRWLLGLGGSQLSHQHGGGGAIC